jgi:hypothetical protein
MSTNPKSIINAGDLTHEHLGSTVRLKVGPYVTVEDELVTIGHGKEIRPSTMLMFKNVTPDTMGPDSLMALFAALNPKRGFFVSHDTPVEVSH